MEALDPLNKVLQESLLYNAHGRKRYFDPNLVDAFNFARSKFPRLDDILCNAGDPEQKAKLIEGMYIIYLIFTLMIIHEGQL